MRILKLVVLFLFASVGMAMAGLVLGWVGVGSLMIGIIGSLAGSG